MAKLCLNCNKVYENSVLMYFCDMKCNIEYIGKHNLKDEEIKFISQFSMGYIYGLKKDKNKLEEKNININKNDKNFIIKLSIILIMLLFLSHII